MADRVESPTVSAVVVAHGRRELLVRLIESARSTAPGLHEILVVDNDSPDDTAAWVASQADVDLVSAGSNLGYGAGVNLGVQRATGDVVVVLNSDVELEVGWLPPLLAELERPEVAIAAPLNVDDAGDLIEAGATVTADGHVHVHVHRSLPKSGVAAPVAHASASCWAIRRAWWQRRGGFDCGFGLGYYEDLDLTTLADAAGELVVLVPTSRVRHVVGGSFASDATRRLSHRNHRRALERWRWHRTEDAGAIDGSSRHRVHGRVLLVGLVGRDAEALATQWRLHHLHVDELDDLADGAAARSTLLRADVVVCSREHVPAAKDMAPRAVVCALDDDVDAALIDAGIAPATKPRRPRFPSLAAVAQTSVPVSGGCDEPI